MKANFYTIFFLLTCHFGQAQTMVSTVVDSADFKFTDDLIFDAAGNLYCADYGGDKVFKRSPNGDLSVFVSGLNTPNGLAFDSQGALFICDNVGNRIYKVDANGNFLDTIDVNYPSGIVKDATSDTMYFTTYGAQSTVKKLSPDGNVFDFHAGSPLNGPVGMEYCGGQLYLANFNDRKIFRVEQDTLVFIAQLPGGGDLGFIACLDGYLFATAFGQHKIYRVDPLLQSVEVYAGSTSGQIDGPLDQAKFTSPNGIVFNATGDTMYVSQYPSGRLRMITGYSLGLPVLPALSPLSVYPNPASSNLKVSIGVEVLPCTLEVYGSDGKMLLQKHLQTTEEQIDVLGLKPGVYMLRLDAGARGNFYEKLVKSE
jgi:sugar lactone lactonase YvrE